MAIRFTNTREVKSNLYASGKGKTRVVAMCDEIVRDGVTMEDLVAQYGLGVCINDVCNKRDETLANETRIDALAKLGVVTKSAEHYRKEAERLFSALPPAEIMQIIGQPGGVMGWRDRKAAELASAGATDDASEPTDDAK